MIIESVDLVNYMSHEATRFELNGERLITISGARGAGKTALVESIEYALWDQARGRTDDLVRIGADDMSATVEWTAPDGCRYRVSRGRTRKAGGKTFLEFQAANADGTWRPVIAEGGIRDVQAEIRRVIGLDAETFDQVAFLMQGRVDGLARAKSSERMDLLTSILPLQIYPRAEKRARELAREVEGRVAIARARLDDLEAELARRPGIEAQLVDDRLAEAEVARRIQAAATARDAITAAIAALNAKLAAGDAQRALVAQLDLRVAELAARYREAQGRRATAGMAAERAGMAIAAGEGATEAAEQLPWQQGEVARLEALRDQDADLAERIRVKREAHAAASAESRQAQATWTAQYTAASHRVDELTAAVAALVPVPCPRCGTEVTPGRSDLMRRLDDASAALAALGSAAPNQPGWINLEIDAGKIRLLEERRRELGHAPETLAAFTRELRRLEALAARAAGVADAQASLAEAQAAMATADGERARITTDGAAAREAVVAAQRELNALEPFRAERAARTADLAAADETAAELARAARSAAMAIAATQATLEGLDRTATEATAARAAIAGDEFRSGCLRRLVQAFGDGGIPSRVIETVIPELEAEAQRILEQLSPGATVAVRTERAKRDGKGVISALDILYRDEFGERDVRMLSGGERMATSLALSLGLSRIVARRAGARIASIAIDEPDGLDEADRRALGQILRVLAHEGDLARVLVISHHADLAEAGDAVYQVSKRGRRSVVELVS